MKIYCGTDIIEIERIKANIEDQKTGKAFIEKIYTQKEIEYCESKKSQKYQHYAARFAAKEAVFKALSDQLENKYDITWKNIEITNNEQGRPKINLKEIKIPQIQDIDISISHCKQYATASVVAIFATGDGAFWQK